MSGMGAKWLQLEISGWKIIQICLTFRFQQERIETFAALKAITLDTANWLNLLRKCSSVGNWWWHGNGWVIKGLYIGGKLLMRNGLIAKWELPLSGYQYPFLIMVHHPYIDQCQGKFLCFPPLLGTLYLSHSCGDQCQHNPLAFLV